MSTGLRKTVRGYGISRAHNDHIRDRRIESGRHKRKFELITGIQVELVITHISGIMEMPVNYIRF